jgi:hypothetical protein
VNVNASNAAWRRKLVSALPYLTASLFIDAVVVGSLCSTSCAHTAAGLARETQLYLVTSNAVDGLKTISLA